MGYDYQKWWVTTGRELLRELFSREVITKAEFSRQCGVSRQTVIHAVKDLGPLLPKKKTLQLFHQAIEEGAQHGDS